ncbi:MAG: zinc ribbon domain-containing protein [Myxococcota bacterium]|nr:zinc ribbon domain-containing protein [Myxococcota bacterium]
MPIYKYRCQTCGEVTEVIAKMSDKPPTECKSCGSAKLEKIVARTAFRLSGGGWYAHGYDGASNSTTAVSSSDTSSDD